MILQPTHHCFDDAVEYLEARVRHDPALAHATTLRLVHAIARIPEGQPHAGDRFAHAWCEERDYEIGGRRWAVVWHAALLPTGDRIYLLSPRAAYYTRLRVERTTSYTIRQVWQENERHRTYGPWRDEYLALSRHTGHSGDSG